MLGGSCTPPSCLAPQHCLPAPGLAKIDCLSHPPLCVRKAAPPPHTHHSPGCLGCSLLSAPPAQAVPPALAAPGGGCLGGGDPGVCPGVQQLECAVLPPAAAAGEATARAAARRRQRQQQAQAAVGAGHGMGGSRAACLPAQGTCPGPPLGPLFVVLTHPRCGSRFDKVALLPPTCRTPAPPLLDCALSQHFSHCE